MKATFSILRPIIAYIALCLGTLLMLTMIIDYASFESNVHFLQFKQGYLPIPWWRAAFYIHVFTSIITLAAGFTQFSLVILRKYRSIHRLIGKIYVASILFINFPSGMILAIYANGLLPTKIAFIILDSLWFYFTYKAYVTIRKGNVLAHRQYMIRSFALTFSAITLRSWKIILSGTLHLDPLMLYMVDAWMGFVPNLLFAEWWIRANLKKKRLPLKTKEVFQENINA